MVLRGGWCVLLLLISMWPGGSALAIDDEFTTVYQTGPSTNRVDLLVVGEGFTAAEQQEFSAVTDRLTEFLFADEELVYHRYRNYFNVHQLALVSAQSGADRPQDNVFVNTRLGATYQHDQQTDELLYLNEVLADAVVDAALGDSFTVDARLVAVNDDGFGGGARNYAVFPAGHAAVHEIAVHELAHTLHGLADEYVSGGREETTFAGTDPDFPNVTTDPEGAKWSAWLGYEQPGIGVIGAYEGGYYFGKGIYRPSPDSKMRTLGRPFDVVAREQMVLDIYHHVDPLEDWLDNQAAVTDGERLWVEAVDPSLLSYEWVIGSQVLPGHDAAELDYATLGLLPGTYFIGVTATDTTDWVRRDLGSLQQQVFWVVSHYPGDFNQDQQVNAVDMDALTEAVRLGSTDLQFDRDGDGQVDAADRDRWLRDAGSFYGDANLDGEVGFPDFLLLSDHFGSTEASWSEGDFDLEPGVTFGDFLLLANAFGTRRDAGVFAVPEPEAGLFWALLLAAGCRTRKTRRSGRRD